MKNADLDAITLHKYINMALLILFITLPLVYVTFHYLQQKIIIPPTIQGMILNKAAEIETFSLTTQGNTSFTHQDLKGKWHILSYGYTQCPDICPTTLMILSDLTLLLQKDNQVNDVEFLFYTIDPFRDSVEVLSKYINYFNKDIIALRTSSKIISRRFERSLGIKATVEKTDKKLFNVSHSLSILVINPEAKLQAVLLPDSNPMTQANFTSETLYKDYMSIKNHYQINSDSSK
jgi:protein SCO1/2